MESLDRSDEAWLIPEGVDRYGVYGYHVPVAIPFRLTRMTPGKYTIERYTVSRKQGSSYDTWVEMGTPAVMNREQREYLAQQAVPGYVCQTAFVDKNGILEFSSGLELYEIQHIRIKIMEL